MRALAGLVTLVMGALPAAVPADAADQHDHRSAYAGEETRTIKALSPEDVDDLLNGRGWGFAKAAELNGMPGPAHLLEMADEIGLRPNQRRAIEALFAEMQAEAQALGRTYVDLERRLDQAFADGAITPDSLAEQVAAIADVRGRLRLVHLRTHLRTPDLLTPHQIVLYNRLRGYGTPAGDHHHAH